MKEKEELDYPIINLISIIKLEWNAWNGFIFSILDLEIGRLEGALLGVSFSKSYFNIEIFFFTIEIKSPFPNGF